MLAESNSGYCYNLEIYAHQRADDDVDRKVGDVTYTTVMRLTRPCFGRGHHLYLDNYYTSPQVLGDLLLNHVGACGTLRASRKGVPSLIRYAKLRPGQALVSKRRHGIQYLCWWDKRQVNLASTIHNANTFQRRQRTRNPEHKRVVEKPVTIELYTGFMGGVDRADQILWTLLPFHKTVKWWIKVFFYLLEVSMVNARIIYQAFHDDNMSKRSSTPFRENIIAGLLSGYLREVRRPGRLASLPAPLQIVEQQHSLRPIAGKHKRNVGDCIVYSDRNKKRCRFMHECRQCRKPICVYPCFGSTIPSWTSRCHAQGRTCTRVRLAAAMMTLILLCRVPPGHHHHHQSPKPRHHCQRPGYLPVA